MKTNFDDHQQKLDEVLAQRSREQAILIMDEFKKANNDVDLMDVIKDQLGGDIENAYCDLSRLAYVQPLSLYPRLDRDTQFSLFLFFIIYIFFF